MNQKLTLRMDESLIASAKNYAAAHGSSVSQMVANYFAALGHLSQEKVSPAATQASTDDADWEQKLGPITRSLIGIACPTDGSPPPTEEDYYQYLEKKHSPK
ncbi:DUF6364 family protein [Rhodoferax sp.]|uniref:DUF6364 family protein n=1 Tax=Rhodoferax sp. TaxID=50421 RepID=UPI002610DAF1|nr:DUF6364 family protein [Rhodoferax sp.]MDD2810831.1 DUF6364 family protein [Rhodoferax sp.]